MSPTSKHGVADDSHEAHMLAVAEEHCLQRPSRGVELHTLIPHNLCSGMTA